MSAAEPASRQLGVVPLIGMLSVPLLFCWLFLRRGYGRSLRVAVFSYTAVMTLVPLIGRSG